MKLRDIEEMATRNGLTIVRIVQSKRIKVTVQRADGATETQSFPRNERDPHAIKNREACLARFAKGFAQ